MSDISLEKIVSLAKRRGFIYPGSEIYGGLAGTYDYGPLGVALKNNLQRLWWKQFVDSRDDMFGMDSAILMNRRVWEASGHAEGFTDPLVACGNCGHRFRADHLKADENGQGQCLECNEPININEPQQFNMMFQTRVGATGDEESKTFLRPETAQGMFVNFKNIIDTLYPDLPFGIAQVGKAFRNEIAPREFLFRTREFEQMEVEYFIREEEWEKWFKHWQEEMNRWIEQIGLSSDDVHERDVPDAERAHYAKRTIDFEYDYPFGRKELYGLAYRTDYDLKKHAEHSGVSMEYQDKQSGDKFTPHVIEPSLGMDRTVLALLCGSYREDELSGESRVFLGFKPEVAPVRVAVFPLLKNKPKLVDKAKEVYQMLKAEFGRVWFDDNGNIGKRYRRQDEIGTPQCVTIDFDTLEGDQKDTVTVRDRDTGEQTRVAIEDCGSFLRENGS